MAKRLAQCLNPALPAGVHSKALEVYAQIFKTIGVYHFPINLRIHVLLTLHVLICLVAGNSVTRFIPLHIWPVFPVWTGQHVSSRMFGFNILLIVGSLIFPVCRLFLILASTDFNIQTILLPARPPFVPLFQINDYLTSLCPRRRKQ